MVETRSSSRRSGLATGRRKHARSKDDTDSKDADLKRAKVENSSEKPHDAEGPESSVPLAGKASVENDVQDKVEKPKKKGLSLREPGEKEYTERVCTVAMGPAETGLIKIVSWNVGAMRPLLKRGILEDYLRQEDADFVCLQETRFKNEDTREDLIDKYLGFWSCSTAKKGYSGTVIFARKKPRSVRYGIGNSAGDQEGRTVTLETDNFFLVNAYVPNSGAKLVRLDYRTQEWEPAMRKYLKGLENEKPVILCGDLNVAHREIDIHDPKGNKRNAGFTIEERQAFSALLRTGLVDTFRSLYPKKRGYSFWSRRGGLKNREANKGWRLDYFVVSRGFLPQVKDSFIRYNIYGSDHAPVGLLIKA